MEIPYGLEMLWGMGMHWQVEVRWEKELYPQGMGVRKARSSFGAGTPCTYQRMATAATACACTPPRADAVALANARVGSAFACAQTTMAIGHAGLERAWRTARQLVRATGSITCVHATQQNAPQCSQRTGTWSAAPHDAQPSSFLATPPLSSSAAPQRQNQSLRSGRQDAIARREQARRHARRDAGRGGAPRGRGRRHARRLPAHALVACMQSACALAREPRTCRRRPCAVASRMPRPLRLSRTTAAAGALAALAGASGPIACTAAADP
eukprot:363295-Chlamydomonas_euryale.AAC.3